MPSVSQAVMTVLSAAEIEGCRLALVGQLDRKLYAETNKVLEAAGGRWDRKAKAHVFDGDAIEAIEPILLTGEYRLTKQDFGQFDTPPELAARVVEMAEIEPGMRVLEPSAGIGRIVVEIMKAGAEVLCVEIDDRRASKMKMGDGMQTVIQCDFMKTTPVFHGFFDRVVMNPPFAKQADIDHVMHAYRFLKPGGVLVAIMSAGVTFREDRKSREFRQFVDEHGGTIEALPPGSFKSSGTMVNACVVKIAA